MATSYNGWPASTDGDAIGIDPDFNIDGITFPGGVKAGDVSTVLGYVAGRIHREVEPLVPGWNWGYEPKYNTNDPGSISCHASGTAIDYNAPNHPNGGSQYGGWTSDGVATIREILAECEYAVQWGADYSGTKDPMHFEIIVDADTLARVANKLSNSGGGSDDGKDWFDMASKQDLVDVLAEFFGTPAGDPSPVIRTATVTDGREDAVDWPLAKAIGSTGTHAVRAELAAKG